MKNGSEKFLVLLSTENRTIMIKSTKINRQGVEWILEQPFKHK